jgi:hypothetical protein
MTDSLRRSSGIIVLALLVATVAAAAQSAKGVVDVKIDSVLAADTNQGCDKALSKLRNRLRHLFHYSTYHLVAHAESHTAFGQTVTFTLPGGRILHIEPMRMDGDMIQMEVMLFQGEVPMMTTDLEIMNGGTFMVGGPRYERGTLIISIKSIAPAPVEITPPSEIAMPSGEPAAPPATGVMAPMPGQAP